MEVNRTALITDASHPAAAAIAARLKDEGITVINNYPHRSNKGVIEKTDNNYSFDTWLLADMKMLLDMIISRTGGVDHLIHTDNAILRSKLEDMSEQDFKRAMDYNAKSAFITTKVFGEHMAQKGDGTIVYLSTLHDEKPTGCAFAYSTAKGSVKMLCKEIALFYGRKGIRANVIEADYMEEQRELLDSLLSPFNYDAETKIPLKRLVKAEDIAGVVSFLISKDAVFINGADIRLDGGHMLYYGDR
ncbi:SDR family NAD(P)-dependent oxidoreductase [Mahella australiensis]|uniref:Short-chain dehydrogenase/reductase SDR n=1 Tax=Mahella australiensis (strain DSM 15567 / CIP 107919 / 50-1 BON) TaxID=697281 RepID=F4A2K5_MAHA5|nr:SDR family oxidoreductase [Mahella australiensis]AEE97271.1 short-chain dehydrogenase/reductase SDR [Mahella australiensis 50-1 BON]